MSTGRASIRVLIDGSDAIEKLTDLRRAVARLAHPLMSEDELEELVGAGLSLETERDETDT